MDLNKIKEIKQHIKKVYSIYARPFVIGFSGGKDSTATLQMVWEAIKEIPKKERTNDIYVICTDTLVETPYILTYINDTLNKISKSAKSQNLPINVHKLTPLLEKTFWVNLIGKGYPAPSQQFRWCTERLKINPVDRFVEEQVSKSKEVTVVLGARSAESSSRQQVLSKTKRDTLGLSKHPTLPEAYVYTPIENLTTDEVWTYLLSNKCAWGGNNRDLAAIYQNADDGECPMVVDKSTPSCGNSRFGCWVCTLVQKDTTMQNLIDSGEEWMTPLFEFREMLSETQNPSKKPTYRNHKRRDGQALLVRDGTRLSYGPYKIKWRKIFLKNLLSAQKQIQEEKPEIAFSAISIDELEMIRQIWRKEAHDWQDSVPTIYKEVTGENYPITPEDGVAFTMADHQLLEKHCESDMQVDLIARLIDLERNMEGMTRRAGIINKINKIFNEEWRPEEEIQEELKTQGMNK
jgi:DNA sulfur modification protein DndC